MSNKLIKETIVIHSGGMDSSLCLHLAIQEYGRENVLSMSFIYGQRHSLELAQAKKICQDWQVDHTVISLDCLEHITTSALIGHAIAIEHLQHTAPNTLVTGRNGLMARLGAIHAQQLQAKSIFMGVMGCEAANSGYRDCSRSYMDLMQHILRLDLDDPAFEIKTPLVHLTKKQTLFLAYNQGILGYLLNETISCYEGVARQGCKQCPACHLRNEGIRQFIEEQPAFCLPYPL